MLLLLRTKTIGHFVWLLKSRCILTDTTKRMLLLGHVDSMRRNSIFRFIDTSVNENVPPLINLDTRSPISGKLVIKTFALSPSLSNESMLANFFRSCDISKIKEIDGQGIQPFIEFVYSRFPSIFSERISNF